MDSCERPSSHDVKTIIQNPLGSPEIHVPIGSRTNLDFNLALLWLHNRGIFIFIVG
jgi:hypothetical protein